MLLKKWARHPKYCPFCSNKLNDEDYKDWQSSLCCTVYLLFAMCKKCLVNLGIV